MGSFTEVTQGNNTNAADINQIIKALNGTSTSFITVAAGSGTPVVSSFSFPSVGSGTLSSCSTSIVGDAVPRAGFFINASGQGGIALSPDGSTTYTMTAVSTGIQVSNLTVTGSITNTGSLTVNGISTTTLGASGAASVASLSSSGAISCASLSCTGAITGFTGLTFSDSSVALRSGSSHRITASNSAPGSPSTGDIWINTSISL